MESNNPLTFSEFQQLAMRTWNNDLSPEEKKHNAVYGIAGEIGELIDYQKKVQFHKHPSDPAKVAGELGDVLHYIAVTAHLLGLDLNDVYDARHSSVVDTLHKGLYGLYARSGEFVSRFDDCFESGEPAITFLIVGLTRLLRAHLGLIRFMGYEVDAVARGNIEKLRMRYPQGFSVEASLNRSV